MDLKPVKKRRPVASRPVADVQTLPKVERTESVKSAASNKPWILALIICLLVVVVGGGIFYYMNDSDEEALPVDSSTSSSVVAPAEASTEEEKAQMSEEEKAAEYSRNTPIQPTPGPESTANQPK